MELGAIPKTKTNLRGKPPSDNVDEESEVVVSIDILPNEILEYILAFISPYSDLDSCSRVSRRWNECCRRVVCVRTQHFRAHIASGSLLWSHQPVAEEDSVTSISKRYSHCAVYHPDNSCMYVFGGCTSTSSTFNDLWELSLSTRTWRRPLSMGAYPSPKACASMVRFGDCLVLFGGWTHPSLYPLHQSWKLFSELHIYSITENRWTLMASEHEVNPPAMAGHSASVHGNMMIVFGGLHKQRSVGHYTSSNDLWIYHLDTNEWERKLTGGVLPPLPRYGQSQLYLDAEHLLVLGGCGGPNNEYSDIWLLDMTYSPWTWIQMEVRGHENRARDIWCHPAVRVGDCVVVLGKCRTQPAPPSKTGAATAASSGTSQAWNVIPQLRRGINRGQGSVRHRGSAPAPHHRQSVSSSDSDMDLAVEPLPSTSRQPPNSEAGASNRLRSIDDEDDLRPLPSYNLQVNNLGRPGGSRQQMFKTSVNLNISGPSAAQAAPATLRSSLPASNPVNAPNALIPVKVTPAHSKVLGPAANTGNQDPSVAGPRARELAAASGGAGHSQPGAPGNPGPGLGITTPQKNRQKMLENRQRQLASLQRMEEKIRNSSKAQSSISGSSQASRSGGVCSNSSGGTNTCPHHRMTTHILDISHAISDHYVTWQLVSPVNSSEAPQESILYSLVLGRTELVMFGGLQKDIMLEDGESVIHELRDLRTVPLPYHSYDSRRGSRTPIVIDNGGQEMRAGWAGVREPLLVFRSVLAKTRRDKMKESELLVGSDITNIEAVRHALRSPFDKNVVTHLEAAEHLLDHTFSHLGLDTLEAVEHPVLVTEAPGQPNMSRHLYSQLLFELYSVPGVGYGVDSLFSLGHNIPGVRDALVVSLGHQTVHIIPVLDGQPVINKARRLNIGGAHMIHHLQRSLQLKYQNHVSTINLSRAEEMFTDHTKVVRDFFDELRMWKRSEHYDRNVVKIQLPYTVQARPPPADPEVLKAKRQELAKRLVELNARKRCERLLVDEAALRQMLIVKDYHDQGNISKFSRGLAKLNLSLTDINQLELHIEKLETKIEKAREAKTRHDQGIKEEKDEPEVKKRREDMSEKERNQFDDWISDVRNQLNVIKDKKQARQHRRQQMAKRRTAASQERMRIISQLAKNTKKDDTFGMNDDDWDVYKQISVEGGDSDSEEENLRSAEYEAILKEHDPQDDEVGRENPEWHQIHLAAETIRTPEILFQPSIIGHDQAGLGELIEFVLSKFSPEVSDRLANNVFVTGGLARLRGLKERLEAEIQTMRPFQSSFKVTIASDPVLDAWKGASKAAANDDSSEMFMSRNDYFDCGEGYLKEHFYSNKYFPTPSASEKLEFISNPTTPSVKEEASCPPTPMQMVDSSNPSSPSPLVI